jgi:hypothetical protein
MAKSSLDLRGAKGPKLELDFLRLAYAVRDFLAAGENAVGYLAVLDNRVAGTAAGWIDKYHTTDQVSILCCIPKGPDIDWLMVEKADNSVGFLPDRLLATHERKLAIANFGRDLGEKHLKEAIEERHPGIIPSTNFPLGINWDYYGILNSIN